MRVPQNAGAPFLNFALFAKFRVGILISIAWPGIPRTAPQNAAGDPDPDVFVTALGDIAQARGTAQIAKDAGLGRESLYKT
jgi:hypothetical protein